MENEPQPAESETTEESTSEIEKPKKVKRTKKDRSPAQIESFAKARQKRELNFKKRELAKLEKYAKLKQEVGEVETKIKPKKKKVVVVEESESSDSESSVEVVLKRKAPRAKVRRRTPPEDYDSPDETRQPVQKPLSELISWL